MDAQHSLVATYGASDASKVPGVTESTAISETPDDPWYLSGVQVGSCIPASTLNQLPGLENIEDAIINPKKLRQLTPGQIDAQGRDIGGFYVVSDVGRVWLHKDPNTANKWAEQVDVGIAPSLTLIDSGQENVGSLCDWTATADYTYDFDFLLGNIS